MGPQKQRNSGFLKAISRSRAAEQKAEKRLGGVPRRADQVIGCLFFRRFAAGSFSLHPEKTGHKGKLSIVGSFVCRQRK